uniref:RRM domain-containing protein n=1 Tax=Strongyloides stercoralis TaxID=6248 RepID=A0A0K0E3R3_STRER
MMMRSRSGYGNKFIKSFDQKLIFIIISSTTNSTAGGSNLLSSKKNIISGGGVKRSANSVAVLSNVPNQTSIVYSTYSNSLTNPSLSGLQSLSYLDCPISTKRLAISSTLSSNNCLSTKTNNNTNIGNTNSVLINTYTSNPYLISNTTIPTSINNTNCEVNSIPNLFKNCCGNLSTNNNSNNNNNNSLNINNIIHNQGIEGGVSCNNTSSSISSSNNITTTPILNSRHQNTSSQNIMGKSSSTGSNTNDISNFDTQGNEISHYIESNNNVNMLDMGQKREEECQSTGSQNNSNTVLRVIFGNVNMAISLDVIYTCFSRYGKVLRIITFTKNNIYQALVQLSENKSAEAAFSQLDGKILIPGCNPLKIEYSKLTTLNIKYNNEKSRDYTKPHLPAGDFLFDPNLLQLASKNLSQQLQPVNNLTNPSYTLQYSNISGGINNAASLLQNNIQYTLTGGLQQINPYVQNIQNGGTSSIIKGNTTTPTNPLIGHNQSIQNVFSFPQIGVIALPSPVVLVTNLDSKKINPDMLFTLFGVYGDVQKVKILYNQRSQALIEFSEPQQAFLAVKHLDNTRWNGNYMRVAPSKFSSVQIRLDGKQDESSTKDYTHSPLHRFRKPGSKNYMNIYPPNSTLHLSNIPLSICEQFLVQAFEKNGFNVKAFKFFPNNHKMALIQLDTIEAGINSLITMHNFRLAENAHLKVSFSKSVLKPNLVL